MKRRKLFSFSLSITSLVVLVALVGQTWAAAYAASPVQPIQKQAAAVVPTFVITSVQADQSVTIKTSNFPANETFNVLMNTIGTKGIGGTQAGTVTSGSGGSFSATINIPAGLKGQKQIAIRLESTTSGILQLQLVLEQYQQRRNPVYRQHTDPRPDPCPFKHPNLLDYLGRHRQHGNHPDQQLPRQ